MSAARSEVEDSSAATNALAAEQSEQSRSEIALAATNGVASENSEQSRSEKVDSSAATNAVASKETKQTEEIKRDHLFKTPSGNSTKQSITMNDSTLRFRNLMFEDLSKDMKDESFKLGHFLVCDVGKNGFEFLQFGDILHADERSQLDGMIVLGFGTAMTNLAKIHYLDTIKEEQFSGLLEKVRNADGFSLATLGQ